METRAYRLRMHTALHVGDQGIGNEKTLAYLPSDTLFSGLVVTWATLPHLQASLSSLVDPTGSPPLLLTSAFPYVGNVKLLPRPALALAPQPRTGETTKSIKKARWVSEAVFAALAPGIDQPALDALWGRAETLQAGSVWVDKPEAAQLPATLSYTEQGTRLIWWSDVVPRVTVDRIASASQVYHVGRTCFAPHCGLWFAARGEPAWLERMEQALAVIAENGFGGLRSIGNGQFTLHKEVAPAILTDNTAQQPDESTHLVLLSRWAPTAAQIRLLRAPLASYQLVLVGGFSGTPGVSPVVRRKVRFVAEGSVIGVPQTNATALGQLVDVTPETTPWLGHRIFRYGYGFTVPVRVRAGGKA